MFCRRGNIFLGRQSFNSNIRCLCKEAPPQSEISPNVNDEDKKENSKISAEDEAKSKLSSLLASFTKELSKPNPELKIAKPIIGEKKIVRKGKIDHRTIPEKKMFDAAREVAHSLGGEVEKTEQDLIDRVKLHQHDIPEESQDPELSKPNVVEKEPIDEETLKKTRLALSETLMGMKVDRTSPKEEEQSFRMRSGRGYERGEYSSDSMPRSRLHEFRRPNFRVRESRDHQKPVDFDNVDPLNIFIADEEYKSVGTSSLLDTWDELRQREIILTATHPPRNCFEEMIRWTDKGMLWKLPLDNEIGLEENNISFADHIFLEHHLDDWCPRKGPIRHFMELVCTGLSKNPYLTVERKKAHIFWYRDYFAEKEELLKDLGALQQ